jgi:hypothetical protein
LGFIASQECLAQSDTPRLHGQVTQDVS